MPSSNNIFRSPEGTKNDTPEFTPIGSKSAGIHETTTTGTGLGNRSFTTTNMMSPVIHFSDKYTDRLEKIRNGNPYSINRQNLGSPKRLQNSTGYTLHRTNGTQIRHDAYNKTDNSMLNSSSVASSVWEENNDNNEHYQDHGIQTPKASKLFGNNSIRKGTNIIPTFGKDSDGKLDIDLDSNMLRSQSDLVKKLQSENTNLRVEVLTLRQNLKGLPADSVKLIEQNVLLNQQIIKLKELLNAQHQHATETPKYDIDANKLDELKNQYEDKFDELKNQYDDKIYEYQQENHTLEQEKSTLEVKVNTLESKIEELNSDAHWYENEISSLKAKLKELETTEPSANNDETAALEEKIHKLEDDNFYLQRELEKLDTENDRLTTQLDDLNKEISKKEEEKNQIIIENEKVQEHLHDDTRIHELELEIKKLKQENLLLQKKKDNEKRSSYHTLTDKMEEMTKRLEEASKTIDSLEKELDDKDSQELVLSKEIKQLNLKIESYQRKNESLESRLNKLKGTQSEATDLFTNEINELYGKIDDYEVKIEELESKLENAKPINDYGENYVHDLEDDKEQLYNSLLNLQNIVEKKDDEISNLKLEISRLDSENKANNNDGNNDDDDIHVDELLRLKELFNIERDNHQKEVDELLKSSEISKNNLLTEIDQLEESKSKLIQDFEDLQYQFKELELKYNELMNSRDIEDLSQDLAKVTLEYKNAQDDYFVLFEKYNKLDDIVRSKDLEIVKLKQELNSSVDTAKVYEKLEILEETVVNLKKEKEELENQKMNLDEENFKLKNSLESLNSKAKKYESLDKQLHDSERDNVSIKKELREKKSEVRELVRRIDLLESEKKKLENAVADISYEQDKILAHSDEITEKIRDNKFNDDSKVRDYERKLEEKTNQYNNIVEEYNYMKNDLIKRMKEMKQELKSQGNNNQHGQQEIEEWKKKYEQANGKLKVSERYLQVLKNDIKNLHEELEHEREKNVNLERLDWYPPTPESPSRVTSTVSKSKLEILKAQKNLLMLKLREKSDKVSDLKYMLKYLNLELEIKNEMVEQNKKLFIDAGIGKEDKKRVLTFRSVALVVLASVKFQNRIKDIKERKKLEMEYKSDIEARKDL